MRQFIGGEKGLSLNTAYQIVNEDPTVLQRSLTEEKIDYQLRFRID
jgi:hypothetical protein